MNRQATATAASSPLSAEHYREWAQAQERAKKIRRAAGVAAFNGWATAVFAVFSAPFALFSVTSLGVCVGLALVAWNEFRGRSRLLKFDRCAPSLLGWNQLGFLALIVGYCCWSIYAGLSGTGELSAQLDANPEVLSALGGKETIEDLQTMIVLALYGTVIVLSVFFQGFNALYYFSRSKIVASYVQETPAWVLDVQRSTSAV